MASLCHPWFTTTKLSYRFPIFETSATALCGTTGTLRCVLDVTLHSRRLHYITLYEIRCIALSTLDLHYITIITSNYNTSCTYIYIYVCMYVCVCVCVCARVLYIFVYLSHICVDACVCVRNHGKAGWSDLRWSHGARITTYKGMCGRVFRGSRTTLEHSPKRHLEHSHFSLTLEHNMIHIIKTMPTTQTWDLLTGALLWKPGAFQSEVRTKKMPPMKINYSR